jgi:hypothetical protein
MQENRTARHRRIADLYRIRWRMEAGRTKTFSRHHGVLKPIGEDVAASMAA